MGFYFRAHNFQAIFNWDGESARDVLVAKHLIAHREFMLIAPMVSDSTGLLKNSSLYYFTIAFFWLVAPSPIGVGWWFVGLGVTSILIAYLIGNEILNREAGLIAALWVSMFGFIVRQSQMIWQPHLVTFFSGLSILLLLKGVSHNRLYLFLALTVAFFSFQMHFAALPLLPVIIIVSTAVLLKDFWSDRNNRKRLTIFISYFLFLILNIGVWLFFSVRSNYGTPFLFFVKLFSVGSKIVYLLPSVLDRFLYVMHIFSNSQNQVINFILILLIFGGLCFVLIFNRYQTKSLRGIICLSLLFLSLGGTALNTSVEMTDYYFTPFYLLFILIGAIATAALPRKLFIIKVLIIFLVTKHFYTSQSYYLVFQDNTYATAENISKIINEDYLRQNTITHEQLNNTFEANMYIFTSPSVQAPYYDSALIWYPLEIVRKQKLISLRSEDNNILPYNRKNALAYLTCIDLYQKNANTNWLASCQTQIKEFLTEKEVDVSSITITKLSNETPTYVLYRIESNENLPFE